MQKIKVRGQTEKAFVFVLRLAECPDSSMITAFIVNLFETLKHYLLRGCSVVVALS